MIVTAIARLSHSAKTALKPQERLQGALLTVSNTSRIRLLGGAALLAAGAARAQQAPDTAQPAGEAQSATPLETKRTDGGSIIVTARHDVPEGSITANKTSIPLIQTPQSITVVTRDQIDLLNFIDAQQAVQRRNSALRRRS